MDDISPAISPASVGATLRIEVKPRAIRAVFPDGYNPWRRAVGCSVTAPAEGGKANRAIVHLIGSVLGVPSGDVQIESGGRSHLKLVLVRGMTAEDLHDQIVTLMGRLSPCD
jgi:hypothetical protein